MNNYVKIWEDQRDRLFGEVQASITIWKDLLTDLNCDYAYVKGSGIKIWDGPVDYIPVVSDIDIHFKLFDDSQFDFDTSIHQSEEYEKRFYETFDHPVHLPRMQLIRLRKEKDFFVNPLKKQVRILIGEPNFSQNHTIEELRNIDKSNILELSEFCKTLPDSILERNGLELWVLLRRICWRVSPIASRIINQQHEDPLDVWNWNRTKQFDVLNEYGLESFTQNLKNYYLSLWDLWIDNFQSIDLYHTTFKLAYSIFQQSVELVTR